MGRPAYSRFVCRCGEVCVMVPHVTTGRLAPITVVAYDDGNIRVDLASVDAAQGAPHGTYAVVPTAEREADPRPRPMNHWATCTRAAEFRRGRC